MQIGDLSRPQLPGTTSLDDARLARAKSAADKGDSKATAHEFETIFGVMLVRELRRAMPNGIFGDGPGADVYEGWFDEQLGKSLAKNDALGIAGMVRSAIGRAQAARDATEGAK